MNMKKRYLSFLLLASAISACDMKPMDHFVLRGTIPGAMDSTEIELAIPGENKERLKVSTKTSFYREAVFSPENNGFYR